MAWLLFFITVSSPVIKVLFSFPFAFYFHITLKAANGSGQINFGSSLFSYISYSYCLLFVEQISSSIFFPFVLFHIILKAIDGSFLIIICPLMFFYISNYYSVFLGTDSKIFRGSFQEFCFLSLRVLLSYHLKTREGNGFIIFCSSLLSYISTYYSLFFVDRFTGFPFSSPSCFIANHLNAADGSDSIILCSLLFSYISNYDTGLFSDERTAVSRAFSLESQATLLSPYLH